jgi:uncharacterized membrane protein
MGLLGLVSLAVGIGFVSVGAWPVIGFFGLDVGLVYLAFRLNYRSARQSETLRLAGAIHGRARQRTGERRSWRFQPFGCGYSSKNGPTRQTGCPSARTAAAW